MRFCVLGPLEAYEDGRAIEIGGGRQRALLALLLVHAGEIVSRDRLIDELWSGEPPAGASQSLDAYLSRMRRALREAGAGGALATRTPGYVLHAEETDAADFEATVRAGREALAVGDPEQAAKLLRDGLALWRGKAYVEVADETWARPEAERLEELRLAAMEDRVDAELALGGHAVARVLLGSAGTAARAEIEAALARALELARDTGAKAFEPLVHVELAELARDTHDEEGRIRELREAHRQFTKISATGHATRLVADLATPAS